MRMGGGGDNGDGVGDNKEEDVDVPEEKMRTQQRRRVRKGSPPKRNICIGRRGKDDCMST